MAKQNKEEAAVSFDKPAVEILKTDLAQEMGDSFLEYSYSVIYARAIPDARDGLKPVHRRILYTMIDGGYTPDKPHVKSARIVGTTMGIYHPHGDCLKGDTLILDIDGNEYTLQELTDSQKTIKVAAVNKRGQLVAAKAHSFRVGQVTNEIYHITFNNGHKITATANHPFLAADGSWIKAEDLEFGTSVRSASYNPSQKNMTLGLNTVAHVIFEKRNIPIEMYDFTVDEHSNLFVAHKNEDGSYSLVVAHNSAIYESMVRMAQPFSMRVKLVDGHGNFGGTPDDSPASSRYTESRLSKEGAAFIGEIKENSVDFVPNFDGSTTQPSVLPATFPNLLINGTSGIAVGMATNMPPHNPNEAINAAKLLIKNPEASLEDLMKIIPGPDFPTGGIILGQDQLLEAYSTGKGIIKIRARIEVESLPGGRHRLIAKEHPYQTGFEKIIDSIKSEISKKRIQGITKVIDLTDRRLGTHLVIEVKSGINPQTIIKALYRYTPLEISFGIQNLALVEGQPKYVGLKELLEIFIKHRREVVTRRTISRKEKREARMHLIKGLLLVLADIDKAIAIIRAADDTESARSTLMSSFKIDEIQGEYVLSLQLRRLTKYDTLELNVEHDKLEKEIKELNNILNNKNVLDELIITELDEVAKIIGSERRSEVSKESIDVYTEVGGAKVKVDSEVSDLPEATVYLNNKGQLLTEPAGIIVDSVVYKGTFLGISKDGHAHRMRAGDQYPGIIALAPDMPLGNIVIGTKQGIIKIVSPEYPTRQEDFPIIGLNPKDEVVGARWSASIEDKTAVFISSDSSLLKFPASKVRPQGRNAGGVAGINLEEGQQVIAFNLVSDADAIVATFTGITVKSTPLNLYPPKGRGSKGVRSHKFLKGESELKLASIGKEVVALSGVKKVKLPEISPKRDGSGAAISITTLISVENS